jgi:hypothetical protein
MNNGRLGAALVASAVLLTASSAGAASQAVVALGWKTKGFGIGTYATAMQAGTHQSFAIATVGSTPVTPATGPYVNWAPDQFSSVKSGTYGPFTQYGYPTVISYRTATFNDKGGALLANHPGAPAGVSTVMGTAVATNWCAGQAGSCFTSHTGVMTHSPGAKKYGGAASTFRLSQGVGQQTTGVAGPYKDFAFKAFKFTGAPVQSANYRRAYATTTNTGLGTPMFNTAGFVLGATYTTGMATAMQSIFFSSTTTGTGSFALNTANLTGMISVVIPRVNFTHNLSCEDKFDTGGPPQTSGNPDGLCDSDGSTAVAFTSMGQSGASVPGVTLTFLPEPGQLALLGFGVLSLAGLQRLRRG